MQWGGQEVRSQNNYILGTDSRLLQNVAVWYARNNTDHYLVLGCLCGAAPDADLRYLGRSTRFPIRTPATQDRVDRMFVELWWDIPRPPWREHQRQAWISPETWSLINTRINVRLRKTCSSPRRDVLSHYLVCSKNYLLIVGIGPILNKELELMF